MFILYDITVINISTTSNIVDNYFGNSGVRSQSLFGVASCSLYGLVLVCGDSKKRIVLSSSISTCACPTYPWREQSLPFLGNIIKWWRLLPLRITIATLSWINDFQTIRSRQFLLIFTFLTTVYI